MKRVVSVSLGSSKRDNRVEQEFLGQPFTVERIGTDGDREKAVRLIGELDGTVDAFGMGGTDLYIYVGTKRYTFKETEQIARAAAKTPIVDGSGLKNTLERTVVQQLQKRGFTFKGKNVLLVCGVDRFGMAESLIKAGANVIFGDLMFGLGIPIPLRGLKSLGRTASLVAPLITRMPISMVYPTGKSQEQITPKFEKYYHWADIIAGDFHFIKKHLPDTLAGKTVLTNTVTEQDIALLRQRGVVRLITTTPEMGGRSFGTNVMEAVLVALLAKPPSELKPTDYLDMLHKLEFEPRIEELNTP